MTSESSDHGIKYKPIARNAGGFGQTLAKSDATIRLASVGRKRGAQGCLERSHMILVDDDGGADAFKRD